jgi:PAS domain S-box-containing protein
MNILVVDDNEQNRYQLQVLLGGNGYTVGIAVNGAEALAKARQSPPDLIITDILMPIMDGFSLCREWKRDERLRDIPLVFYTATYTDEKDRELALNLGAAQFLVKPEDPDAFLKTIRAVIAKQEHGTLAAPRKPIQDEKVYLKEYSGALIRKLEEKKGELEQANRQLERDLAERKQAEAALRESERRYQTLAEVSPVGIFRTDAQGQTTYVNPRWCQISGLSAADAFGDGWLRAVHPEDREKLGQGWHVAADAHRLSVAEYRFVHSDGTLTWVMGQAVPEKDRAGRIVGYVGTVTDITALKQAQDALRLAHERVRGFIDSNIVGVAIANAAGGILEGNDYYLRLIGYNREELEHGKIDWRAVTPPEWLPADDRAIRELRERGTCTPYEKEYVRRDGTRVPVYLAVAVLPGPGELLAAFVLDLTKQRQTEAHNREQAALLDNANDAIYVRTLDRTILYWNKGAERTYGWTSAEVLNRKTTEMISLDPAAAEAVAAALLKQGSWSGERWQTTKGGRKVEVFSRLMLVRDKQGQPQSVFAINTDITEKKQLEAQFLRAQRLESIGALASGIAHDLNNVLAPIIIGAPLVRDMTKDETSRDLLTTMESSALRGAAIVRQVLTFARGVEGERVLLQPRHVLREMEKLAAETFPKGIRIDSHVAADLWPVLGDSTQLHQALLNLCVNARDAMPGGGVLTLEAANVVLTKETAGKIRGAKPGSYACLRVTDTGTGIPPETEAKMFEPFFTTKGVGKGTGLGLSTVLGIVRSHGGFLRVANKVGRGTTFELYLPATTAERVAVEDKSAPSWPRARGECILVVDDEASIREVARQALMEFGFQVMATGRGTEALRIFREHRGDIQLVLTDMMMPEMDGSALIAALRVLDPAIKIVGITGMSDPAGMNAMKTLELSGMLAKPFTIDELLAVIREVLPVAADNGGTIPTGGKS